MWHDLGGWDHPKCHHMACTRQTGHQAQPTRGHGPAWPTSSPSMIRWAAWCMKERLGMLSTWTLGKTLAQFPTVFLLEKLSACGSDTRKEKPREQLQNGARASSPAQHWCPGAAHLLTASFKGSLPGLPKDEWNSWTYSRPQVSVTSWKAEAITYFSGWTLAEVPGEELLPDSSSQKEGLSSFQSAKIPQNTAQGELHGRCKPAIRENKL